MKKESVSTNANSDILESDQRFRSLVQDMHAGVLLQGPNAEILLSNPIALELLGLTEDQLLGKTSFDPDWNVIHEDGTPFPGNEHPVPQAIITREPVRDVVMGVYRPSRGDRVWLLVFAEPRLKSDGTVESVVCTFIDISKRKQVQEALQESEERLRALTQSAYDAIITIDRSGKILGWNRGAENMFGYPEAEITGKDLVTIVPRNYVEKHKHGLERIQNGGEPQIIGKRVEFDGLHKNGTEFPVELSLSEWKTASGNFFTAIISNITNRKQSESFREFSREVLQLLNEAVDREETVRLIVSKLKDQVGFDSVGIRLQNGNDFPFLSQVGFPEQFLQAENTLINCSMDCGIKKNKNGNLPLECACGVVLDGSFDPANPNFTKSGSFWTNRYPDFYDIPPVKDQRHHPRNKCVELGYASVALIPIRNQERNIGLIQLNDKKPGRLTLDIIELLEGIASKIGATLMRLKAEEALNQLNQELENRIEKRTAELALSEQKYKLLSENISDGIFIFRNGSFEYVNKAMSRIFGYTCNELEGNKLIELVLPEYKEEVENYLGFNAPNNEIRYLELECLKKDGSVIFVEILLNYMIDENVTYGVVHDITENKQNQKNIIKAIIQTENRERAYFSNELHDGLGPLLSTIKLYLQWSQRPKTEKSREEIIQKAEDILEEALIAVKEIANKLSPHLLTKYGLTAAIQRFINKLEESKAFKIIFHSNISRRFDIEIESAMYRALIECINNTLKYADASNIYIFLQDNGSELQLTYQDDGKGFDIPGVLSAQKGLGLYNLQNRINNIGGKIILSSEPGQGVNYQIVIKL